MKKTLVLAVCLVASAAISALDLSFGADLGFNPRWESYSDTYGDPRVSRTDLGFGAFLDAEYLLLEVNYVKGLGEIKTKTTILGVDSEVSSDNSYAAWQLGLLGKYPIDLGGFTLAPMGGIRYRIGRGDSEGTSELLLAAGLGAQLSIERQVYIRPRALLTFPVSSDPSKAGDYFGWGLDVGLSVGFRSKN
jgi:hypothetical protein